MSFAFPLLGKWRFLAKTLFSSYYRRRPSEIAREFHARRRFTASALPDRLTYLTTLGVDAEAALSGIDRWRPLLDEVLARKSIAGVYDGLVLYGLVRALEPEYVIETGVAEGVSTSFIGAALVDNGRGRLYSIELPPEHVAAQPRAADGSLDGWAARGPGHLVPEAIRGALGDRWELRLADVREALPALLDEIPYVDLFFHDDLHTPEHQLWEYELVWPRVKPGGALVSDDITHAWPAFVRRQRLDVDPWRNFRRMAAARKPVGPGAASPARATA